MEVKELQERLEDGFVDVIVTFDWRDTMATQNCRVNARRAVEYQEGDYYDYECDGTLEVDYPNGYGYDSEVQVRGYIEMDNCIDYGWDWAEEIFDGYRTKLEDEKSILVHIKDCY